jgi:signal peptidase I
LLTRGDEDAVLGSDEYFMMGDNRPSSWDSRSCSPFKQPFIVGTVWLRGWPLDRLTRFEPVGYNLP